MVGHRARAYMPVLGDGAERQGERAVQDTGEGSPYPPPHLLRHPIARGNPILPVRGCVILIYAWAGWPPSIQVTGTR